MFFSTIFILSFVSYTLPEPLNNFDIIIIPISKELRTNLRTLKIKSRNYMDNRDNLHRIDIENYDEPTEMPNIDNFDYNNDRNGESMSRENINIDAKRNNVIRYLALRSDTSKNSYKHESDGEDEITDPLTYEDEGNYGENKIVGGQEVDINLYPYHVAYGTNCGGAIIGRKWVITAGHCGKKPFIRVGNKYVNQGTKVNVKHSYIHPEWPAKNKDHPFDYDFQLLELEENLKFGDNIQPIKIAHIEDMVIGKVVTVTGWGNTKENGPYSNVLRAVRVPIISKENCQHVPFPYFRGGLTARMFCAGFSEGRKDACQGDSGGPAVANDRLIGMVSFGYGCATPGSFGVYSKVAKVRSWIEEVTGLKLD